MKARLSILGLCLLAACGKDATAPAPVATLRIIPPARTSFPVGDSTLVTATMRDAQGSELAGRAVTWASSDPTVASVRPAAGAGTAATVLAVKPGNVTITAASEGRSGAIYLAVTGPVTSVTVSFSVATIIVGGSTQLIVESRDANNNAVGGGQVTYGSSNTAVATVSSTGLVVGVALGTSTISAVRDGMSGSATVTVVLPPPGQHAFLWTAAGGLTDLGVLPGFLTSFAVAINAGGVVVGGGGHWEGSATTYRTHAVRWSAAGVMQDLGTLPGGEISNAAAINTGGQVAGYATVSVGDNPRAHAVLWGPTGDIRDLGTLPGDESSSASGINDAGQVVGSSYRRNQFRSFVWTEAVGMVEILPGLSPNYFAVAINSAGVIVGRADMTDFSIGFRRSTSGLVQQLPFLAGDRSSAASAINDAGAAVGYSRNDCDDYYSPCLRGETPGIHAVFWTMEGTPINLGALPGFNPLESYALGLNNRGQVVGQSRRLAFLWSQSGGFVNLGILPGRSESAAYGVNDAGQVVGSSY